MTPTVPPNADPDLVRMLDRYEQEYQRSLPPEHYMEAYAQGKQREITLESFALVHAARPDVQCFNEILVQYPRPRQKRPGQVVPDNFVVIHPEPVVVRGNFSTHVQTARLHLVLEYVSKQSERKDYDDNFKRYERGLKVPYYLLFYPDNDELTVFRLGRERYASVAPNAAGRLPIPELELEVALLDGWARFWFRGKLLPLPGDLQRELNDERQARAEAEQARAEAEQARLEAQEATTAERQARLAAEQRAESEYLARLALEAELARLRSGQP